MSSFSILVLLHFRMDQPREIFEISFAREQVRVGIGPSSGAKFAGLHPHPFWKSTPSTEDTWSEECKEAVRTGEQPPKPKDELVTLPHRPCLRRVGKWMADGAGLGDLPTEPMAPYRSRAPWVERDHHRPAHRHSPLGPTRDPPRSSPPRHRPTPTGRHHHMVGRLGPRGNQARWRGRPGAVPPDRRKQPCAPPQAPSVAACARS